MRPVYAESGSGGIITYSDVQGIDGGIGNISKDPLFVDIDTGDLHLMEGSPCIDSASGLIAPGSDVEGILRQDDPASVNVHSCIDAGIDSGCVEYADMGAYEYVP